jgi:hypothetical protein
MRRAVILICSLVGAAISFASPVDQLRSISHFAFGGVGVAGTTSEGETAFMEVLAGASAKADFERLLKTGNPQGKCYALVGLRAVDVKLFEAKVVAFEHDQTPVNTIGGCIVATLRMNSVVANIRAGHYDAFMTTAKRFPSRSERVRDSPRR